MPGVSGTGGGPRNRAYFSTSKASGGGAGPTLTARLDIGPDFGEAAGNDDTTFIGQSSIPPIDQIQLVANLTDASAVSVDALALAGDLNDNNVIDFQQLNLDGALETLHTIDVFDVIADYSTQTSSGTLFFDQLDFAGDLTDSNVLDLLNLSLEGDLETSSRNGGLQVSTRNEYSVTDILYTPIAMNLREDAADSQIIAGGTTVFFGTNPFLIRPETVDAPPVNTEDERVAYFKWDLTVFDSDTNGDTNGADVETYFEITNPNVAADANITFAFRVSTTEPFSTSPYSWNNYEPVTTGSFSGTFVRTAVANTTQVINVPVNVNAGNIGKWLYCKVTSDLVGTLIQIRTFDVDNDPDTTPHDAPYVDYTGKPR